MENTAACAARPAKTIVLCSSAQNKRDIPFEKTLGPRAAGAAKKAHGPFRPCACIQQSARPKMTVRCTLISASEVAKPTGTGACVSDLSRRVSRRHHSDPLAGLLTPFRCRSCLGMTGAPSVIFSCRHQHIIPAGKLQEIFPRTGEFFSPPGGRFRRLPWGGRPWIFAKKKAPKTEVFDAFWSCWADSNRRPHPYQGCALPTELQQQNGDQDGARTHDLQRDRLAF